MEQFKKANLNAPRFRPKVLSILNQDMLAKFKEKFPEYKDIPNETLKQIIRTFHTNIRAGVIDHRNGVELMNSMGILFIGSCKSSSSYNVDYSKSNQYNTKVTHKNWETDGHVCKIFYTNFPVKYKVRNREVWGFDASREFSHETSAAYKNDYRKYMVVNTKLRISNIFEKKKRAAIEARKNAPLGDYNEFDI